MLVCSCSRDSSLPRQPAPVHAPAPLMPLEPGTVDVPEPPGPEVLPASPAAPASRPGPAGLIAPIGWPAGAPLVTRPLKAPQESRTFIDVHGRLERGGRLSGWRFVFDPASQPDGLADAEILPGDFLEQMERIVDDAGQERILFHVIAEVTRYKQRQYLVIRRADYAPPAPAAEVQP